MPSVGNLKFFKIKRGNKDIFACVEDTCCAGAVVAICVCPMLGLVRPQCGLPTASVRIEGITIGY